MNKVYAIIKREYLTKVRKKSFIILTILMPVIMLVLMTLPLIMTKIQTGTTDIAVFDQKGLFEGNIENTSRIRLTYVTGDIEELKVSFKDDYDALLHIPNFNLQYPGGVSLYAEKQVGLSVVSHLEKQLEYITERARFEDAGIDKDLIERLKTNMRIESVVITDSGERVGNNTVAYLLGLIMGMAMYFIVFAYGSMVMSSIVEEKKNRIVEILATSVRPFEIMIGKIIGMAGVAITQLFIWAVLGSIIFAFFTVGIIPSMANSSQQIESAMESQMDIAMQNNATMQIIEFINNPGALHLPSIALIFAFYFIFAYLFYATLYAALGSLSDSDDGQTQQFAIVISLPIIISMMIMLAVLDNPHSSLAIWGSMIPFSSPIVMLARIPSQVPISQIILSGTILILSFLASTWVSGKIYRMAILLYGKKFTWKDLWKFIRN